MRRWPSWKSSSSAPRRSCSPDAQEALQPDANDLFIILTARSRSRNDTTHHSLPWEGRALPDNGGTRICLVTEELSYGKGSGGIGGAFHELALALRRAGHSVDLIYLPPDLPDGFTAALVNYYAGHGVRVIDPNIDRYVWAPYSYEKRSYALFRYLISVEEPVRLHPFSRLQRPRLLHARCQVAADWLRKHDTGGTGAWSDTLDFASQRSSLR